MIAAVVAALIGVGSYLASRHYAPIVAGLNQQLGKATQALADDKAAYGTLASAAALQNASILALQTEAAARKAQADAAVAAAEKVSAAYQARAAALLASQPAAGSNVCVAASALVDAQIREDRQ
ncbi:TPA: hypothetical protein ACU967_002218 [Burkholderia contaminans]|uniref:hypothetical protein n=1 Tax=Burkholderia contaminans TaxID=488447 RepID=UPI0011B24E8C|nr:hypothetical protein [Burkholderia contaminans]MBM6427900.1 hypothetical protein [Burkholderia contaminans]MCA7876731.1 hypothetical protein [Burkholderia contaminans]MDN8024246.1 hypothetical protein [Burkholderia contaminans]HDR9065461.1 hypothetical protein [Burkholderia vietnamiensis]